MEFLKKFAINLKKKTVSDLFLPAGSLLLMLKSHMKKASFKNGTMKKPTLVAANWYYFASFYGILEKIYNKSLKKTFAGR